MLSWLLPASLLRQDGVYALAYWTVGAAVLVAEVVALLLVVRTRPARAIAAQEAAWALAPVLMLVVLGVLGTRARHDAPTPPVAAAQGPRDR
jgi:hypothetical protein